MTTENTTKVSFDIPLPFIRKLEVLLLDAKHGRLPHTVFPWTTKAEFCRDAVIGQLKDAVQKVEQK